MGSAANVPADYSKSVPIDDLVCGNEYHVTVLKKCNFTTNIHGEFLRGSNDHLSIGTELRVKFQYYLPKLKKCVLEIRKSGVKCLLKESRRQQYEVAISSSADVELIAITKNTDKDLEFEPLSQLTKLSATGQYYTYSDNLTLTRWQVDKTTRDTGAQLADGLKKGDVVKVVEKVRKCRWICQRPRGTPFLINIGSLPLV